MYTENEIVLRREEPEDYGAVERLTRKAFWNLFVPGCAEHYIAHILRGSSAFISELDYVALLDGKIVGNIMYTKAQILLDDGGCTPVVCFGPISVMPEFQRRGIGRLLISRTAALASEQGHAAILIYGDPDYYSRLGFVPAERYGIANADSMYAPALQALELVSGTLKPGRFFEDPVFQVDANSVKEFDYKNFPYREEKDNLPSQARFKSLLQGARPR